MGKRNKRILSLLLALGLICGNLPITFAEDAHVQDILLSDSQIIQEIKSCIDVDYGYNIAKDLSLMSSGDLGFRTAGSTGELQGTNYIEQAMKDLGLSNVRREEVPVHSWNFAGASLEVNSQDGTNRTLTLSSYAGSAGTSSSGIAGEIVYIGDGSLAGYANQDVTGKIVLAEFDMMDDYWISAPAYQAELKGATAFILAYNGENYGTTEDGLNSFDVAARDTIPIMNMSRADAKYIKEQLESGTVQATLISNAAIDKNGKSYNVIGEIPGKKSDQYIILGAHYDGYFYAFQDDVVGVGIFMSVAKAMLDAGYEPEHTILFIAHGSEEYGITDNHYDWVRGSWYQINHNQPKWAGQTMMFLNFDTQRPDGSTFVINANPEYESFFEKYAMSLSLPEGYWTEGLVVSGTNGPWSDDYNYISAGVPGLITGKGNTEWKYQAYHTNYDTYEIYDPVTFRFNVENYTAMAVYFDLLEVAPFDFTAIMSESLATLDSELISRAGLTDGELKRTMSSLENRSASDYANINYANTLMLRLKQAEKLGVSVDQEQLSVFKGMLESNRKTGMEAFKVLEKEYTKLDSGDVVVYGHEVAQINLSAVMDAKAALENSDGEAALQALTQAESGWMLPLFDQEVYEYWGIEAMNPERTDLYWGTGKVLPVLDLYNVYHQIQAKTAAANEDYTVEIAIIEEKIAEAKQSMDQVIEEETKYIRQVINLVQSYTLEDTITVGESLLKQTYAALPERYQYQDIPAKHWAYAAITGLLLEGVLEPADNFAPNSNATRGEVAQWLTEAFNLPIPTIATEISDVPDGHPYHSGIQAVMAAGLMAGTGNGNFAPDAPLTRAQMATIAANILGLDSTDNEYGALADIAMEHWFAPSVKSAFETEIVTGTGNDLHEQHRSVTKAEACTFIERLMYLK